MMISYALAMAMQALAAPVQPAASWTLTPQKAGCLVTRSYLPDQNIQIGVEALFARAAHGLVLAAPAQLLPSGNGDVAVRVDDSTTLRLRYTSVGLAQRGIGLIKLSPEPSDWETLSTAKTLVIGKKLPPVAVSDIRAALAAVDDCTADLVSAWGGDPNLFRQGRTAKVNDRFLEQFGVRNYPREALKRGIGGRIVLFLKTDPDGSVNACRVMTSAHPLLDADTCAVAKRVRLTPPVGEQGVPIASFAIIPLTWFVFDTR